MVQRFILKYTDRVRDPPTFLFSGSRGVVLWGKTAVTWEWSLTSVYCRVSE